MQQENYFGLLGTSGYGSGDSADMTPIDHAVAEGVAARIFEEAEAATPADSSGWYDTGALSMNLQGLLSAPQRILQGMLGMGIPQAQAQKILPHVAPKVQAKASKAVARKPALRLPAAHPMLPPHPGPMFHLPTHQTPQHHDAPKMLSFEQLMDRLQIRQLANYSGTVTAGDTVDIQVKVTRDGTILNWSNSDGADDIIVRRVLYGQDTTTVYNDQSLGAWSSKAAHKVPVEPIDVRMPNVFDATLENPTADDIRVVWTMWGLTPSDAMRAMRDRDVAYTLQQREIPIALAFQGFAGFHQ